MRVIDFSLILPLLNEGIILPDNLARIFSVLEKSGFNYEVILIDDGSQDETVRRAKEAIKSRENCYLIEHRENIGRGGTVAEGIKKAKGKVAAFIDVDLEVGPDYLPLFGRMIINQEADIVTGLRRYQKVKAISVIRFIFSRGYERLVKLFLDLPFKDTETGYKFFSREKILPVLENVGDKGWFWDTEVMARSQAAGLKIKEVPVDFKKNPAKKSTVKIFRDSLDYFFKLYRFSRKFKQK